MFIGHSDILPLVCMMLNRHPLWDVIKLQLFFFPSLISSLRLVQWRIAHRYLWVKTCSGPMAFYSFLVTSSHTVSIQKLEYLTHAHNKNVECNLMSSLTFSPGSTAMKLAVSRGRGRHHPSFFSSLKFPFSQLVVKKIFNSSRAWLSRRGD